ncbi:hypothetical protein HHK36_023436 [Tetracentron sinense]|uniref:Uncharacterized protein n=1 Tax=Tetracentron sinense TaxID=13715 RepID=A0A834YNP6_TETSI|nr:hypothetical protein HHK36_023436 [Tetracentron sinense]
MYKNSIAQHFSVYLLLALFPYIAFSGYLPLNTAVMPNNEKLTPVASLLLYLNLCMYLIVSALGGWAINRAVDQGTKLELPAQISPIVFPMGNAATGLFVLFALIAGVVGAASAIAGILPVRTWTANSLLSAAIIAWALTLLAMGFACKEIKLEVRHARMRTEEAFLIFLKPTKFLHIARTMEGFLIILSATQLLYILLIYGVASSVASR